MNYQYHIHLLEHHISKYDIDVHGVNPILIKALREALDNEGFNHVQIIVSSGFDVDKIELFKKYDAPVDVYNVLGSLLGRYESMLVAAKSLPAGTYVISNGIQSQTIVIQ